MPEKDISQMSKEEIRAFIDTLSKEEFIFAYCIARAYEELEQKYQILKKQLKHIITLLKDITNY